MKKPRRRPTPKPEKNARRLLQILTANFERTRDPALRERLQRAIAVLKAKAEAA
jgi:hypothetical protein